MDQPTPRWRQGGRWVTVWAWRKGANSAPETASSSKLQAGSQLLTKSSWDPGRLVSVRKVTARDQHLRRDNSTPETVFPLCTQDTEQLGLGRWWNSPPRWEEYAHQASDRLSCLYLRRAQNADPTESVPLWSTREPESEWRRSGKCMQPRACFRQFPGRATWSLSSVDWKGTHAVSGRQTQCGPDTVSTPHTHQWYLFPVFLPPRSTIEQVSLNKWPPLPPRVRVEVRYWRDLQTEEAKVNKEEGTALEVTGATD